VSFWQAVAFQWVNPKALMMCTSALAAFTSLEVDFTIQVFIVAGTFLLMSFPTAGIWLVFGAGLQRYLKDPRHLKIFNIVMAVLLVLSIIPVMSDMFIT